MDGNDNLDIELKPGDVIVDKRTGKRSIVERVVELVVLSSDVEPGGHGRPYWRGLPMCAEDIKERIKQGTHRLA